eukprot:g607.t1
MERFGTHVLQGERGSGRWLKLAAGEKAEVLGAAMKKAPNPKILDREALENASVITVENDPVHAVIAMCLVARRSFLGRMEVLIGHSLSLLPRLVTAGGRFGGVFMDTRGSRYDQEVALMIEHDLLAPHAVLVADNVLKPGTPLFLWLVMRDARFQTQIHAVNEFAMPAKDWISVSIYDPREDGGAPQAPPELFRLHEAAEEMRTRALSHVRSVTYAEWARFAQEMPGATRQRQGGVACM